jgi:hypothetical protein
VGQVIGCDVYGGWSVDVPEDDRYVGYEGLAIEIARFFKGGPLPVSPEETLEIFALLQAAELSRAKQGAMVRLPELGSQVTPDR